MCNRVDITGKGVCSSKLEEDWHHIPGVSVYISACLNHELDACNSMPPLHLSSSAYKKPVQQSHRPPPCQWSVSPDAHSVEAGLRLLDRAVVLQRRQHPQQPPAHALPLQGLHQRACGTQALRVGNCQGFDTTATALQSCVDVCTGRHMLVSAQFR